MNETEIQNAFSSIGIKDQYDLILLGDGAGSTRHTSCGWWCLAYFKNRGSPVVKSFYGGTNAGTNNFAELMPYLHVLWVFQAAKIEANPSDWQFMPETKVLIISDSEVTVKCGNGEYSRNANQAIWTAMDWFAKNGYSITYQHIPRNSNVIHQMADAKAKSMRALLEEYDG